MGRAATARGLIVMLLASVTASAACRSRDQAADGADTGAATYGLRGSLYPAPLAKPDLVLTDTHGQPYDFRRETAGYLTLLYFGYTNCPDVCPIHMANLGAVIAKLPPDLQERIRVVFVTTDPARDTPERLKAWLHHFSDAFVGLTGDTATINAAQRALFLPASSIGTPDSTGAYVVGHSAAVIAFTPDDSAHVRYPFGVRQADWAHDLPRLLELRWSEH
jgi:protein SCO1/2